MSSPYLFLIRSYGPPPPPPRVRVGHICIASARSRLRVALVPAVRRELSRIPPRFKPKSVLRRNRARTVRVGILICFDGEFPEPARCLAAQGAQIILLPTALGSGPVETLLYPL